MKKMLFLSTLAVVSLQMRAHDQMATYESTKEKTEQEANDYQEMKTSCVAYLTHRDLPQIFKEYVQGTKALDYGCGTGITVQFLKNLNFDVVGADISDAMLSEARATYPENSFYKIENNTLPFADGSFDFVLSSFVVLCIESKKLVTDYFRQAHRVLKKGGTIVVVTVDEDFYKQNWTGIKTDFKENDGMQSGSLAKAYLDNPNIEFVDYYWTNQDCIECMESAGFEVIKVHHPLGKTDEPYAWGPELTKSPYAIFVGRN